MWLQICQDWEPGAHLSCHARLQKDRARLAGKAAKAAAKEAEEDGKAASEDEDEREEEEEEDIERGEESEAAADTMQNKDEEDDSDDSDFEKRPRADPADGGRKLKPARENMKFDRLRRKKNQGKERNWKL